MIANAAAATVAPVLNESSDCPSRWFLGCQVRTRATAADTAGGLGMIEQIVPPGFGSPYHVHRNEDESFYILEGQIHFYSGESSYVLGPGGFAFLPRNIPHGFRTEGDVPSRSLLLATPGNFINFVADLSTVEPLAGPPDMTLLMETAARYNVDILGPLPE